MKRYAFALSSLLATGLLCAQAPAPAPGPTARRPHARPTDMDPDDMLESRLTRQLGLNATQQNTVHTVLAERRVMTKGLNQQMQTLHGQMVTAVKNGDEASIDKVTTEMSGLRQQQDALHAKAMSKIYATLTADQKTKVGPNLEMLMHPGFGGPGGPGFGRGAGRRGAPPTGQPQQ